MAKYINSINNIIFFIQYFLNNFHINLRLRMSYLSYNYCPSYNY